MRARFTRSEALSRGARGGASLLLAGSAAGVLAGSGLADPITDADLAYARLLVGAELLAADFYTAAIAAKQFGARATAFLERALFNEQEHYASVSGILTGAGQPAATAADFEFAYPAATFDSKGSIVKLAIELEMTFLGAYLGAVASLRTETLKQPIARIAACEAGHLGVFTQLAGRDPVGNSFPSPLAIDEVSGVLDAYSS